MAEKFDCMALGPRFPPDEDVTIVISNLDGTDGAARFPGRPHCRMLERLRKLEREEQKV
jgi:hypothetical protein